MSNEFSELLAADISFGNHILGAWTGLSAAKGPAEFCEFLTRASNQQVIRHDADSCQSFLKDYIAAGKGKTTAAGGQLVNYPILPVCWYCRKPGLVSSEDMNNAGPYNRWQTLWNDNEDVSLTARALILTLSYKLAFIARDKPTLDKLNLAWYSYVSDRRSGNHKFTVKYRIQDKDIDLKAEIIDPITCSIDEEAGVSDAGNFFATSTMVEVNVQVLFGDLVEVPDTEVEFVGSILHG